MENAKTIKQLLDIEPLSDGDYLPVNQPDVVNPITHQEGDTRKITVQQLVNYVLENGVQQMLESTEQEFQQAIDDEKQDRLSDVHDLQQMINSIPGKTYIPLPEKFLFASDKRKLTIKEGTRIKLPDNSIFNADQNLEFIFANILDTGSLANGKDYYLFLYRTQGGQNVLVASLTKSAPDGLNPADVVLIGGFHTLCVSAGSGMTYVKGGQTLQHPLNDFIAADILPDSVWCLNHKPYSEPEGMVYVPSLDFWCDIYKQSGSGMNTKSAYQGAITRSRQYVDHVEDMFCIKKELLDDGEFAAAMLGSNEKTTVAGANESGANNGGAGGRNDTAGRRMISIYGIEEGCGATWEWLRTTSAAGVNGTIHGQISASPVTYDYIVMTQSACGPYGQAGNKGSFYGLIGSLLAGGNWSNGASCGSRARDAGDARSKASTGLAGRGRSRALHG